MTSAPLLEFTAAGSPKGVAQAIEVCAQQANVLNAIVVPWESGPATLTMAVTLVKADGWAIEHTNVGTITVTELGDESTRVAVIAVDSDHTDQAQRVNLLLRLAGQIQGQLCCG